MTKCYAIITDNGYISKNLINGNLEIYETLKEANNAFYKPRKIAVNKIVPIMLKPIKAVQSE